MHFPVINIAIISGALLLSAGTAMASSHADEGERRFGGPLLSRLLPGVGSQPNSQPQTSALPSRFQLGFFSTDNALKGDPATYRFQTEIPHRTTIASFGYGSYYGASRLDLIGGQYEPYSNSLLSRWMPQKESLSLTMEAGVQHADLHAGVMYAYQNREVPSPLTGFSNGTFSHYPMYIFATGGAGGESLVDGRSDDGQAVFFYLGYNLSQQLNVRGALGLAKTSSSGLDDQALQLSETSRRWGVDVAATYRLLDNLVYEAHLGYVNIDDTSPSGAATAQADRLNSAGNDATPHTSDAPPTSQFHIGSHIRMTF